MGSIYKCTMEEDEARVLEALRDKIAEAGMGVTLTGNRLTVRWMKELQLVDVHMIIENVRTPEESRTDHKVDSIMSKIHDENPELEIELFEAEHGHPPQ